MVKIGIGFILLLDGAFMIKNVYDLLKQYLPLALLCNLVFAIAILIFFRSYYLQALIFGTALGILNFILLDLSIHFVFYIGSSRSLNFYTIFFLFRFIALFFIIYAYKPINGIEVVIIFLGFLSVKTSIGLKSFYDYYLGRKEDKNGKRGTLI